MKTKILGVANGQLMTTDATASSHRIGANLSPSIRPVPGASSPGNVNTNVAWPSQYLYYFTGILPAEPSISDPAALALMWRDIYLYDSVCGATVDLRSTFPFSDYTLHGVDSKKRQVYYDALAQLNIREMMPTISWAHDVDGFFCGTMIYDADSRRFIDTMVHDALQCSVSSSPFLNRDPAITVTVSNTIARYLGTGSQYARDYIDSLPTSFRQLLEEGRYDLNPVSTLFIPRKTATDRAYVSYLHRVLPIYLIEKALYRGTLTEVHRRQRALSHITSGDSEWVPTAEELDALTQLFQQAESDPLGGWVSTRNPVSVQDLRPAGDFLRWMDISDQLTPYKLRALGVSESFLGSDATFSNQESAYSMFLEDMAAFREKITNRTFSHRIFPMVAIINGFYKEGAPRARNVVDFFYNATDRANLEMPKLHWNKALEPDDEENMMESLRALDELGIPVPLKMMVSAAGINFDTLVSELEEDARVRETLEAITGKSVTHESQEELEARVKKHGTLRPGSIPLSALADPNLPLARRIPLLARRFGSGDRERRTVTGKRTHVLSAVKPELKRRENENMVKIATRAARDPNYRYSLMRENAKRFKRGG